MPEKLTQYLEVRSGRSVNNNGLAADLARHLYSRQHLGSAVVVALEPLKLLCVVRKQWFKIARTLQRERAGTVNAQKILHLTYAVTRMHALSFVAQPPEQRPDAKVFFVLPDQLQMVPTQCYSLYVTAPVNTDMLLPYAAQLAREALVVDYANNTKDTENRFRAKNMLGDQVRKQWHQVVDFLSAASINIKNLASHMPLKPSLIDDALDLLLDCSEDFLHIAGTFQYRVQLAQPLELHHETQAEYNIVTLLAHRVQALSTGELDDYLGSVGTDSSFFLRSPSAGALQSRERQLAELMAYHQFAGHTRIYNKLATLAQHPVSSTRSLLYEAAAGRRKHLPFSRL